MRPTLALGIAALSALSVMPPGAGSAHAEELRDVMSDTWTATDGLGRSLPGLAECGPPRADRQVGIFYFLWLGEHANGYGPFDVSRILAQDPDATQKPDSPLWGPLNTFHHWGEPLFGYYQTDDAYVLRKHAQMLADIGVDVVIFDVTNQITYRKWYMALLDAFSQVRQKGGRTPQVAFLCPFGDPARVVRELYTDLYAPGVHPELWYRWDGKPLILADPTRVPEGLGNREHDTPARLAAAHTLGQTFTVERPLTGVGGCFPTWATKGAAMALALRRGGPTGERLAQQRFAEVQDNAWLTLDFAPPLPAGTYYLEMSDPSGTVGWWSLTRDVLAGGQAYADSSPTPGDRTLRLLLEGDEATAIRGFFTFRTPQPSYFEGPTKPDMWSWLEVHPQHVFLNSRGEKEQMSVGVAQNAVGDRLGSMSEPEAKGRSFHNGSRDPRPGAVLHGLNLAEQWERALREDPRFVFVTGWNEWIATRYSEFAGVRLPVVFVDQFDQEHSRDIEPMRGGHRDNYYYQLASCIRRYKGVRPAPAGGPATTIRIAADFAQWADVTPEFRDDIGDAARRDHPGYNHFTQYTNRTGRNDFVSLKVAADAGFVYFYARTREAVSPCTDPHWMLLFLDTDGNPATGWEGFDVLVNRTVLNAATTVLSARQPDGWQQRCEVPFRVSGNELMLAVPREALALGEGARPLRLQFKWADNLQQEDDPDQFTLNGDCAPNGRFRYQYVQER